MKKFILVAASLLSLQTFAQKVTNQLNFPKGSKLNMTVQVNSTVSQGMGDIKLNASLDRVFDIEDVTNAGAVIEHKLKRVQVNFESMMGKESFDSDKPEDLKSDAGKSVEKAMKNKYTMTVDKSGRVVSVKKDDDNPNPTADANTDMISNVLSQITSGLTIPNTGDATDFAVLPARAIGQGDTWTDTANRRTTVYTVTGVNDADILLDVKEDATTEQKQEVMGMSVTMKSKDKSTGKIVLDRKTGLLKEKTMTTDSEGTMEAMGQSAPITRKTTTTWTVK